MSDQTVLPVPPPPTTERRLKPLTIVAIASLGAGAIHAAAIGAHADHPAAARVFVGVALFQMGWGAVALARRDRRVALVGAVGNALLVGGWILAKWKGINFINGLNGVEPIQFADAFCAALAALSAVGRVRSTSASRFGGRQSPCSSPERPSCWPWPLCQGWWLRGTTSTRVRRERSSGSTGRPRR